jgi:hypothetical protein
VEEFRCAPPSPLLELTYPRIISYMSEFRMDFGSCWIGFGRVADESNEKAGAIGLSFAVLS